MLECKNIDALVNNCILPQPETSDLLEFVVFSNIKGAASEKLKSICMKFEIYDCNNHMILCSEWKMFVRTLRRA